MLKHLGAKALMVLLAGTILLILSCARGDKADVVGAGELHDHEAESAHQHTMEAVESMTPQHLHMGPHMKWTQKRPQTPEDLKRVMSLSRPCEKP